MIRALLLAVAIVLPIAKGAAATDFGTGRLPIHAEVSKGTSVSPMTMVVVEGRVEADQPVIVVLRIDDDWSNGTYGSRVNEERSTPPGPFRWVLAFCGIKTSGGRALRTEALRGIHLFNASPHGLVNVSEFRFEQAPELPGGTVALSLGSAEYPLFPGFERVAPGDLRLLSGKPVPIRRPGVDALIGSGMRGVERFRIAWPAGRARVTLWVEDVGEWETLPYFLRRRIRINGVDVVDEEFTPQSWIERRYLRGAAGVFRDGDDSWQAYGRHRGGQVTAEVDVAGGGIDIELAGDTPAATFLAAVLVEPSGADAALRQVTGQRREWFNNAWPVDHEAKGAAVEPLPESIDLLVARGTGRRLQFDLPAAPSGAPPVALDFPGVPAGKVRLLHWIAQPRLDRVSTGGNLLRPNLHLLRSPDRVAPQSAGTSQRHVLWIEAAEGLPPGGYAGSLKIGGSAPAVVPIRVTVPELRLPPAPKAAGFYLETPPHLGWFAETAPLADRQLACDMQVLARLGVSGNAPPLPAPLADRESEIVEASRQALQNATAAPWLAYSAAKRTLGAAGMDGSVRQIREAMRRLKEAGLPAPLWSVADEPSNPGEGGGDLRSWVAALRQGAPEAKLAGHLNAPRDAALVPLFDVALVNDGFGIDLAALSRIRRQGVSPWLYNTGNPRLSAGVWLWRSEAARYLQWHARMPTADAFDPTDGREGDVQMFPPMAEVCAAVPDIDEAVLEMAEGVIDQRWLAWLESEPRGAALLRTIRSRIPAEWHSAVQLSRHDLEALRSDIEALARPLK